MTRFRAGHPDAIRDLYARYGRAVFVIAIRTLGDRSLAEEAVQDTFVKAWRAAARFDPARPAAPWLYAIARRAVVDIYRREARHQVDRIDDIEIVALPPSFEHLFEAWEIRRAVDALTDEERAIVEAAHYRGMTHEEIASDLGIPLGTVKSRSHRAHRKLSESLAHLDREALA